MALNTEEAIVFELNDNSGALTEVYRENFGTSSLPFAVDARADGALYITFTLASQIGHFQVDPQTGRLLPRTTISQPLPEGGVVSPDGRFYFHCEPDLGSDGSIHAYSLDASTGTPTEIAGSPFVIPGSVIPQRLYIHPNGRFLYVAERGLPPGPNGVFYAFEINGTTGGLSQIGSAIPVITPITFAFSTSPNGETLFVSGNNSDVSAFSIDMSSGALTALTPNFVAQDAQLGEMVVDAIRGVFYVCGYTTGQVEAYRLDTSGRPGTAVLGSPFLTSTPNTLTTLINSSGDFLLTTNVGVSPDQGTVSCFRIASDGGLTPVPGSPFAAGVGTFDMALVRLQRQ